MKAPKLPPQHILQNRYSLVADLVCVSALHIGAGKADEARSLVDLPVAKDSKGDPYIPGSSFRGVLRSGLESLLRGLGRRVCNPLDQDLKSAESSCSARIAEVRKNQTQLTEGKAFELAQQETCEICAIFGNSFLASRLWIPDLMLKAGGKTYTRDGVGIDRDLRSVAKGMLYNFEALAAGTEFQLRLELDNAQEEEVGLLLVGLDLFEQGFLSLGGKSARGLGKVKVGPPTLQRRQAADYFKAGAEGSSFAGKDALEPFRKAALEIYGKEVA